MVEHVYVKFCDPNCIDFLDIVQKNRKNINKRRWKTLPPRLPLACITRLKQGEKLQVYRFQCYSLAVAWVQTCPMLLLPAVRWNNYLRHFRFVARRARSTELVSPTVYRRISDKTVLYMTINKMYNRMCGRRHFTD